MADTPKEDAQENTELFEIFRRAGLKSRDAHYATQILRNTASANLITSIKSELRTLRSRLDAQNTKFAWIQWLMAIGVTGVLAIPGYLLSQPWN